MLTSEQRKYLHEYKKQREEAEYKSNTKWMDASRHMNLRIRKNVTEAIEDLTLCARELPENQLEQIFTKDTLSAFINSLLSPSSVNAPKSDGKIKNRRIFEICYYIEAVASEAGYDMIDGDLRGMFESDYSGKLTKSDILKLIGKWENIKKEQNIRKNK